MNTRRSILEYFIFAAITVALVSAIIYCQLGLKGLAIYLIFTAVYYSFPVMKAIEVFKQKKGGDA